MNKFAFWNNKGGTGKTSLAFQTICTYAQRYPEKRILVVDLCPQANLSELLLGGQSGGGTQRFMQIIHGVDTRKSIGGYFHKRLSSPFNATDINANDYIITPYHAEPRFGNNNIASNIDLICGDPLIELQTSAMNTLSNTEIPTINSWEKIIDWLNDLLNATEDRYDQVFIDTNPSFSIYTQIALAAADGVIVPVMADDSSRRAFQNVLALLYGIRLPSDVYEKYTFATKMKSYGKRVPKIKLIVRNRMTQYMGEASAYNAVLQGIDDDLKDAILAYPEYFDFNNLETGTVSIKDFGTTGVVSFARGCPFINMSSGTLTVNKKRIVVKREYLDTIQFHIGELVKKI